MCAHHVLGANNQQLPYTCKNAKFETDTNSGLPHSPGKPGGSYYPQALAGNIGASPSLWLEYVVEKPGLKPGRWFWLIWYDPQGCPMTVSSAVFDRAQLREMLERGLPVK
jgi:hypothetical protein